MKKVFAVLLFALASSFSFAASNSSPGLYYGQIPTAGQWNSYFSGKLDYNAGAPNAISYWDASGNLLSALITGDCTSAANIFTCASTSALTLAITDDVTTSATMYPTWVTATTGNLPQKTSSTKLTFNPSTGMLSATGFTGAVTGTASGNLTSAANSITLSNIAQVATNTVLGNSTSLTANITAMSVSGCSSASSALIWTTNTGFGCNTSITANTSGTATNLIGGNNTTLLGSIPYQSNTNVTTLLSPNTTAVKWFLSQTGTGSNGAVPAWGLLVSGDIPSNAANTSGTATNATNLTGSGTVSATTTGGAALTPTLAATATVLANTASGLTSITTVNDTVTYTTGGITLASQTAAAGSVWRVRAFGTFVAVSSVTARNAQIAAFWGSTQLVAITPVVLVSVAQTTNWEADFTLSASSTTAIWTTGYIMNKFDYPALIAGTTAFEHSDHVVPASTTVTAGAQTLDLRVSMSTAVATDQWTVESVTIERIK